MRKTKRWLIVWFVILAVGAGLGTSPDFQNFLQYSRARGLYARELYPEAEENAAGEQTLPDTMDAGLSPDELRMRSDYASALASYEKNELIAALEQFQALGDYNDSGLMAAECREALLDSALLHMKTRQFDIALEEFAAADLPERTGLYRQFCEDRLLNNDIMDGDLILTPENLMEESGEVSPHGKLYRYKYKGDYSKADYTYIYVPDTVDPDTKFICFFPGGNGAHTLPVNSVCEYIQNFEPNAILVLLGNSGTNKLYKVCTRMIELTTQVAAEAGIAVDHLVVAGHSNGGYTALHCAEQWYSVGHVAAKAVITLDMGMNWNLRAWRLTAEEQERMAEAGTTFYAFEPKGTGQTFPPILEMVRNGCHMVLVHCLHKNHKAIMLLAFEKGVFSWALGEAELPAGDYTLIPMTPPQ